ncbi:hypothetical protein SLS60_008951 [Paraconiothyrium brasiliense]|uniref:S-adenosyl-L-methionine-dependent methyltransferase n=1 Tax=Paraconiothyrium brasiliense TaxID=300254 RepID=A0ABR3QVY6_9PLEO
MSAATSVPATAPEPPSAPAEPSATDSPAPPDQEASHEETTLELDTATPSDSDADSAFDGGSTASTSLASSILNYEYSNGRRYHGYRSGAYVLPNDEDEQDRLDLLHHIFLMLLDGKLYASPIGSAPRRVLDIGTGTGIWALDFGDENPGSEVVGTDLSPIQPSWVPPNVKFYIDDAESEWVYSPHERFDLIHARGLSGAINDWEKLSTQCYENLQPGGWLEFQEPMAWVESDDDTIERAHNLQQWQQLCNDGAAQFGKVIKVGHLLKDLLLNAGFVDVHEKVVKVPIGPWPKDPKMKEIGRYQREHMAIGIEPYTLGFLGKVLGWSEAECKIMIAKVREEVRDKSLHMYIRFYFVYGRKPESAVH